MIGEMRLQQFAASHELLDPEMNANSPTTCLPPSAACHHMHACCLCHLSRAPLFNKQVLLWVAEHFAAEPKKYYHHSGPSPMWPSELRTCPDNEARLRDKGRVSPTEKEEISKRKKDLLSSG